MGLITEPPLTFPVKIKDRGFPLWFNNPLVQVEIAMPCCFLGFSPFCSFSLQFKVLHLFLFPRFIFFCVLSTLHVATCLLKLLIVISSLMGFCFFLLPCAGWSLRYLLAGCLYCHSQRALCHICHSAKAH